MKRTLISAIARTVQALQSCEESKNMEWITKHSEKLDLLDTYLPHGSGIDTYCKVDREKSNFEKVYILCEFHHLNENGYYEGYTDHKIIVTPNFDGIALNISGKNKNQIKDYLYDLFSYELQKEIVE